MAAKTSKQSREFWIKVEFQPDRLSFNTNLGMFSLSRQDATFLFGAGVQQKFEQLNQEAHAGETWDDIETLRNIVTWSYLSGELDFPMPRISEILGIDEQRLKRWVNFRCHVFGDMMRSQPGEVEEIKAKLRKKYEPEAEVYQNPATFNIRKVAQLLNEGKSPREISWIMDANNTKFFLSWYEKNLATITRETQRLAAAKSPAPHPAETHPILR